MAKGAKLLAAIRANPRSVRFDDACRAARLLGFVHEGGRGSHRVFKRKGEVVQLNFQNRNGPGASQRDGEARFCFNRAEREALAGRPRSISRTVEQLLLSVAQEIDETTQAADGRREAIASRGTRREG